ncbi:PREDICTED: uncharacterized protein LOC107193596 [Dufourea novaeangliae]|nr:PREDICTED: uncharacterized protein LOC107193596 [Dufourea novaeangliae]
MRPSSFVILAVICCCAVSCITATDSQSTVENFSSTIDNSAVHPENEGSTSVTLNRQKRTLLLKKKLIGAGLVGFGLGIAKGYKAGYYTAPRVQHVYLSPPPSTVKYVEYVEKPIFVEKIIETPTSFSKPVPVGFKDSFPYG